jgi:multidrug resistance efflux pump
MSVVAEAPITTSNAAPAMLQTPRRRRPNLRRMALIVGPILLFVAALIGYSIYRDAAQFVSTDNAQLTGQPVQVGSVNAGRVDAVNVAVGARVHPNDVLARVALPSQIGVAQNGQPKLDFLGSADSHVEVTAPFDGVVIAVPVAAGATVAQGQAIVLIMDPSQLWVNANIDETSVERVKLGQRVQVHVDALSADVPGWVQAITPATESTFSLLPSQTSSGNFTKVVQLVPVRVAVNLGDRPALLGTSAEVKIRVSD